ncbi:MAG TPA: hypothetical protein VIG03_02520 [Steroidobacteraceae bacterium]|jgi:hypothetical protein
MKIDVSDGSIVFAGGKISGLTQRSEFLRSAFGNAAREQIANEPEDWRHVAIDPEPGVAATLIFQGEKLHQVFVALRTTSDDTGPWTIGIERERKTRHDAWLRTALGAPPYEYAWGRVTSDFDPKDPASEIIVSYAI